jgi:glycosyltransferase involved in cell wall biosynthesis
VTARLWIVSELYYPEETSTGYFVTKIAEGLADRMEVHALCSRPTYSERHLDAPWFERHGGVAIHRTRSTRFDKDSLIGRMVNLVTFSIAVLLFCAARLRRGDRVLVLTNPPTIPPIVGIIARLRRARSFLLVHDVYPEVLVATKLLGAEGVAAAALGWLTSRTYGLYDKVVVLGRDMAALACKRLAGREGRVTIIPNWGDVDQIEPLDRDENAFGQRYNPDGRTLFQFSGNIGRTHDVESVLEAARILQDRPDIRVQFVGSGGKARLVSQADGTVNVEYLPRQPREMLGPMLSAADAVIISFVDRMLGVSVPSRMYNVMAAGTPIIALAHPDSELARVVAEEGCGWVLPAGDAAALASLMQEIATPEGQAEARRRGLLGRRAAIDKYSLPVVLRRFSELLASREVPESGIEP